jgi:hypothetical protein
MGGKGCLEKFTVYGLPFTVRKYEVPAPGIELRQRRLLHSGYIVIAETLINCPTVGR